LIDSLAPPVLKYLETLNEGGICKFGQVLVIGGYVLGNVGSASAPMKAAFQLTVEETTPIDRAPKFIRENLLEV